MFLVRALVQPVLFSVVFGVLLPKMGLVGSRYVAAMLPGIVAMAVATSALQSLVFPMVTEFGWTREIDDRLLAPVPWQCVALEKILAGALQSIVAGCIVFPLALGVMGPMTGLTIEYFGVAALVLTLAAYAFSAFGLWIGTRVPPHHIGSVFSVGLMPMLMFGCAYYPWSGLRVVPALQYLVLINPLVYVCEGMRAALTPEDPHMPIGYALCALGAFAAVSTWAGLKSFRARALS
jgi:ABC-2 type transport system permease protein